MNDRFFTTSRIYAALLIAAVIAMFLYGVWLGMSLHRNTVSCPRGFHWVQIPHSEQRSCEVDP